MAATLRSRLAAEAQLSFPICFKCDKPKGFALDTRSHPIPCLSEARGRFASLSCLRHNSRDPGFLDIQGILEEGGRGEGAQLTGAATAPVRLVHGVGPTGPVAQRTRWSRLSGIRYLIEHIELVFANRPESLYPCGFRPFLGVI